MNVLRKKRNMTDLGNIFIQADLTEMQRKAKFELRKFAREHHPDKFFFPDGNGVNYPYLKIMRQNNWYRWDEKSLSVVNCGSISKSLKPSGTAHSGAALVETPC